MKKLIWLAVLLMLLATAYFIYDHFKPAHVDKEIHGLLYSNVSSFEKETIIHLQGTIHKKMFQRPVMTGTLILDHDIEYEIILHQDDDRYFGVFTIESDEGRLQTVGSMLLSNTLHQTWIQSDEINSRYDLIEGYVSGPANHAEEANNIARSFLENNP